MRRALWLLPLAMALAIAGCGGSNSAAPAPTPSPTRGAAATLARLSSKMRYVNNPAGQFVFLYSVHVREPVRYQQHIILGIDGLDYWRLWRDPLSSPPDAPYNGQPRSTCGTDAAPRLLSRSKKSAIWDWGSFGWPGRKSGATLKCTFKLYVSSKENPPPVPPPLNVTLYAATPTGRMAAPLAHTRWDGFSNT